MVVCCLLSVARQFLFLFWMLSGLSVDGKEHGPPRSAGMHSQWQPLRTSLPCMSFTNAPSLLGGEWLCEPT